jgi:hypothetical protein
MPPTPKIVLELPDTPAVRTMLDYMATLAKEDELEHWEGELEDAERAADAKKIEQAKAMMAAYDDFWEVVTKTIHPEVLEMAQESLNNVMGVLRDAKRRGR